jgi:hypothetical protein
VQFTWLGENLRLDAKTRRMELMPTADGIMAVFTLDGVETGRETVDPKSNDAMALARRWLTGQ